MCRGRADNENAGERDQRKFAAVSTGPDGVLGGLFMSHVILHLACGQEAW
jgi:hypothetical protein